MNANQYMKSSKMPVTVSVVVNFIGGFERLFELAQAWTNNSDAALVEPSKATSDFARNRIVTVQWHLKTQLGTAKDVNDAIAQQLGLDSESVGAVLFGSDDQITESDAILAAAMDRLVKDVLGDYLGALTYHNMQANRAQAARA